MTPATATGPPTSGPTGRVRRGWRERVEPGIYRTHTIACPATADRRPGRRCACALQVLVPGNRPGLTRTVTVRGTVTLARAERRRLQALGRCTTHQPQAVPTLREVAAEWIQTRTSVLAPNTIRDLEVDYRLRLHPTLGHLSVGEITRRDVERLIAHLIASGAGQRAVRSSVSSLRRLLETAVAWGHIAENPARRVRLPAPATDRTQPAERVLTRSQLASLIGACSRSLRAETMIRAMGEAGLRRGELIGLRWADTDLAARRLHVRRSVSHVNGEVYERTTKGRRTRKVAITSALAGRLRQWQATSALDGPRDYVWPGRDGGPMNAHSPNQNLARALARAGLVDAYGRALVTPHGLRHTAASLMLAGGVPLIVVSRQLGHANPNITAQVYAHLLSDTQLDDAAGALEGL